MAVFFYWSGVVAWLLVFFALIAGLRLAWELKQPRVKREDDPVRRELLRQIYSPDRNPREFRSKI